MAGKIVKATSATITAAGSTGYVTVASTANFFANAKGQMANGGQPSVAVIITDILSTTQMGVRIVPDDTRGTTAGWVSGTNVGANSPNYGRSNIALYNGGTIYQNEQFIYNPNDAATLP